MEPKLLSSLAHLREREIDSLVRDLWFIAFNQRKCI